MNIETFGENLAVAVQPLIDWFIIWSATPTALSEFINFVVFVIALRVIGKVVFWFISRARKRRAQRFARLFNAESKNVGHRRAGNQCEFTNGLKRCRNRSEHGDHFYPHSRGGATSMQNFVAACAAHNLSKGAKMPSAWEKARIEARRKSYFPMFTSVKVGEWA